MTQRGKQLSKACPPIQKIRSLFPTAALADDKPVRPSLPSVSSARGSNCQADFSPGPASEPTFPSPANSCHDNASYLEVLCLPLSVSPTSF